MPCKLDFGIEDGLGGLDAMFFLLCGIHRLVLD